MSRKLLAFLLSELAIVRIKCTRPDCGAVTEVYVVDVESRFKSGNCHVCQRSFGLPAGDTGPLALFAKGIRQIKEIQEGSKKEACVVDLEFVIPDDSK